MTCSIAFSITTVISLAVYLQTASDSIAGGDAGELVAEGCQLGTAHPPGYPLYTVIVFVVTKLVGKHLLDYSPAYLVNATSCLFGSIASGLVAATAYEIITHHRQDDKDHAIAIVRLSSAITAGIMSTFSPLLWQYNTSAEVFALHNLFVASIAFALVKYNQQKDSVQRIVIGAYLCGLSMTNQHTSILLVVPVAAWVLLSSTIQRKTLITVSSLSFLVGLSPYALLPIFETMYPHAGSWGNVATAGGFVHHFLRKDYGTMQLWSGGGDNATEDMITRTLSWANDFSMHQLCHPALLLFLVIGCISLCFPSKRNNRNDKSRKTVQSGTTTGRVIVVSLIFYLAVFHSLSNLPLSNLLLFGVHQRFWMHPNILCFILIGIGFDAAARSLPAAAVRFLPVMAVTISLMTYNSNIEACDQSQNQVFRGYASSILETLPHQSLLIINYDMTWTSVRYLQECEGFRDDVQTINLSMMTYPWFKEKQHLHEGVTFPGSHYTKANTVAWLNGGFTFGEFIDANFDGHNIFIAGRLTHDDPDYFKRHEEKPHGLVRQITRRSDSIEWAEVYRNSSLHVWKTVTKYLNPNNLPSETKYPESTWEWTVKREFIDHLVSRATYLLDIALQVPQTQKLHSIAEAAVWLEVATFLDEKLNNKPSMKKNLGLAYMNIVRSDEHQFPMLEDIFSSSWVVPSDEDWKAWATRQWQRSWKQFLDMKSAKEEADYHSVKQIYESVMKASRSRPLQN